MNDTTTAPPAGAPLSTYFAAEVKRLPRITPKDIADERRINLQRLPGPLVLCTLYGIIETVRIRDLGTGAWIQFRGEFEAIADDQEYRAERCHVPSPTQGVLLDRWRSIREQDSRAYVEFALVIRLAPGGPAGILYSTDTLIEPTEHNPMKHLRETVQRIRTELREQSAG